jgi:hypothetical protein
MDQNSMSRVSKQNETCRLVESSATDATGRCAQSGFGN